MLRNKLVRELAIVLAVKLAFIYGLWFAFFNDPTERNLTGADVGAVFLGYPGERTTH